MTRALGKTAMGANRKIEGDGQRQWIGRRIRRRRLFLGLTQAALARGLGITFQQVQKYENGRNRVSETRLRGIALQLGVAPDYFAAQPLPVLADGVEEFLQSPEGIALCRALAGLGDGATRDRLVMAVNLFCDSHLKPEDGEAQILAAWLQDIVHRPGQNRKAAGLAIRAMKIELAQRIGKTIKARKLTQQSAARILFADQARVSALARGDVRGSSFEKLLRYLLLLGWNANLQIERQPAHRRGKIAVTACDL